jgi:hypothetical protein
MGRIATSVMMHISAWSYSDDRTIWYEFASRRFLELLNGSGVLDHRVYRMADVKAPTCLTSNAGNPGPPETPKAASTPRTK